MTERTITRILALVILVFSLAACGDAVGDETTTTLPEPSTTATSTSATPTTTATTGTAVEPRVQTEIDWFVSVLNGAELLEAEYATRFTDEFRRQVPFAEGFAPVLERFRPEGPFTVVQRTGEGTSGDAVVESADGTRIRVVAELDDQNRFSTLLIQPTDTPALDDPPKSVAGAFASLGDLGTARALAAEVINGRCETIEATAETEPAPLGSVFKLYVLAALGEAVESGEVSWDDDIVIQDDLKSVPSGVLQDRAAGETVTVQETAELMISISDNTATDHLMDLLGRDTIESILTDYGNTSPQLNTPFLDTREFTALKIGPASGLRVQWIGGDEVERRAILDQISGIRPGDLPVQEWTTPVDPDLVEWFASPEDLCMLAVRIDGLSQAVPGMGDILSLNPGIPAQSGTWESLWFKGGSEPGLAAAWFVTKSEGRTFVTTGSVVDPEATIDTEEAILLLAAARDLLAP
jgi:hypothetical protein